MKLNKKQKLFLEPFILIVISLLAITLWDSFLIYPIKFFVVLIHEISHAILAVLSGGNVKSVQIYWNLGGQTISNGGSKLLIAIAGYTGSIVVGSFLFLSSYYKSISKKFNTLFSIILIVVIANWMENSPTLILALLTSLLIYISPRYFPNAVHFYLMKIIGIISVLYCVADIKEDLLTKTFVATDAILLENLTGVSAMFWGLLWFFVSIATVIFLIYYSHRKGLQKY